MNEKKFFIFLFACILLFGSCCTRAGIHNNGDGAFEVRENLGKLREQQTDTSITGERIKNSVGELERTIEDGAGDLEEFKAILQRIRERGEQGNKPINGANTAGGT